MIRHILLVIALALFGIGMVGCEEKVAEVETPGGDIEVTRDR